MAPDSRRHALNHGRKPLVQPALPLIPGLNKRRVVAEVESRSAVSQDAQSTTTRIPEEDAGAESQILEDPAERKSESVSNGEVPITDGTLETVSESMATAAELGDDNQVPPIAGPSPSADVQQSPRTEAVPAVSPNDDIKDDVASVETAKASTPVATVEGSPSEVVNGAAGHELSVVSQTSTAETATPVSEDQLSSTMESHDLDQESAFTNGNPSTDHGSEEGSGEHSKAITSSDEGYASNEYSNYASVTPQQSSGPGIDTPSIFMSLSDHLLQLSHTKMWADWMLVINTRGTQPVMTYAHSTMLVRSPALRKMIERQSTNTQGSVLTFYSPMPIMPHAFEAALRFFYSDAVLTIEALIPRQPVGDMQHTRIAALPYILSYWVSGTILGAEHVTTRSAKMLGEIVDLSTVELIVKEAEDLAANITIEALESGLDWSDLVAQWKTVALSYCATCIDPKEIKLQVTSTTVLRSRLGQLEDSRAKHNPALASMVFGSMPSSAEFPASSPEIEPHQPLASSQDTAISNILLNVDYHDLAYFHHRLKRTWGDTGHQLMNDIVDERESRRVKAVSNPAVSNKQRTANPSIWDVAGFREYMQDGELRRERIGFLLPAGKR